MIKVVSVKDYTIPFFGNKRILPYGKLIVSNGTTAKETKIKDEGGKQYITFNRRKYYVRNIGSLYCPKYVIVGTLEDVEALLNEAGFGYYKPSESSMVIFCKRNNKVARLNPCRNPRIGYFRIDGKVQNFREWIGAPTYLT